jgi:hypothetical protein
MNDHEIERIAHLLKPGIEETIRKTVNGKIDGLKVDVQGLKDISEAHAEAMFKHNEKHEEDMTLVREHIAEVKPYLIGASGIKILGNSGKWIGGIIITIAAAWAILFK